MLTQMSCGRMCLQTDSHVQCNFAVEDCIVRDVDGDGLVEFGVCASLRQGNTGRMLTVSMMQHTLHNSFCNLQHSQQIGRPRQKDATVEVDMI